MGFKTSNYEAKALGIVLFSCDIDKDLPLHKQVYEKAKEKRFKDWEDDIV